MDTRPDNLDALVNRQVRRWRASRDAAREGTATRWPIITVSRSFGAKGASLARALADRLGFEVWGRELLTRIAEHSDAHETLFATLDERARNSIRETIGYLLSTRYPSASEYFNELLRVVHTLGEHGGSVIIGRGANVILRPEDALSVRVVAARDKRVAGLAEEQGLTEKKAAALVDNTDRDRANFIRQHFGRDIDAADGYDLVINSGTLTLAQALDIVTAAYVCRYGDPRADR